MNSELQEAINSNHSSYSCNSNETAEFIPKGKRTKRRKIRPAAPEPVIDAAVSATSSTTAATELEVEAEISTNSNVTSEEEDMANCLILLAQGRKNQQLQHSPELPPANLPGGGHLPAGGSPEKFVSRRISAAGEPPLFVYECKTCSKCFSSFQALGGHRASHRKPRPAPAPAVTSSPAADDVVEEFGVVSNKVVGKVHECSICGAEFGSGQALGGHMRRHRPVAAAGGGATSSGVAIFEPTRNSILSLDLNLPPATGDDDNVFDRPAPAFVFAAAAAVRPPQLLFTF